MKYVLKITSMFLIGSWLANFASAEDSYQPSAEEINRFVAFVTKETSVRSSVRLSDNLLNDYHKFPLVRRVKNQMSFGTRDSKVIDDVAVEHRANNRFKKMEKRICSILNAGNITALNMSELVDTMLSEQDEVWRDMSFNYGKLRSQMTPDGFSRLDNSISEIVNTGVSTTTDFRAIFDAYPLVQGYLMKQKCNQPVQNNRGVRTQGELILEESNQ